MEPVHGCAGGRDGMDGMVCRGRAEILKVAREGEGETDRRSCLFVTHSIDQLTHLTTDQWTPPALRVAATGNNKQEDEILREDRGVKQGQQLAP